MLLKHVYEADSRESYCISHRWRCVFSIVDLKLIEGRLPKRVVALVLEWAFEHRSELLENWQRAVAQQPLRPIAPLE